MYKYIFSSFSSYSICVRPEAGYDCVQWQVEKRVSQLLLLGLYIKFNCLTKHLKVIIAITFSFSFALTNRVAPMGPSEME